MENSSAIFARVSTAPQAEKWSLESQLQFNRKYAKAHGLTSPTEFSIAESGWKDKDRREFYRMVEFIDQHDIKNLLVLNVERLTRDYRGMVALDDLIERKDLRIHFTESAETIDRNSPSDKQTFWAIKVAFARQFIKDLKDKARRSCEIRLDQGLYTAGNPPLGYESKKSHLILIDKEVPFTRRAFDLYASGMESEFSVAEKLYAEGLRTRKGRKVGVNTISALLHSPVVLGFVVWPFPESKYVARPHYKGELIEAQHEGIVDKAVWDKVQEVLKEKGRPHPQRDKVYLARGLLFCGECGRRMSPYEAKGHTYYASNHPRGSRCPQTKCYREEKVTEKFQEELKRFTFPPDLYEWMKEMLKATHAENRDTTAEERKRLGEEKRRLDAKIENALDEALEELFDRQAIRAKVEGYRVRLGQIKGQLARLDKNTGKFVDDALMLLDLVQDLRGTFDQAKPEQRHRLLKAVFKSVVVKDGKFTFHVNEAFVGLYDISLVKRSLWRA